MGERREILDEKEAKLRRQQVSAVGEPIAWAADPVEMSARRGFAAAIAGACVAVLVVGAFVALCWAFGQ